MSGDAPPLAEWLGLPEGYLEAYGMDTMNFVRHTRSEWNSNWKTGVDTFYESYHLPHIHPQTQGSIEEFSQVDLYKNGFSRMIMWFGIKSHRHEVAHERDLDEGAKIFLRDAGIDPDTYQGTVHDTRRDIQLAKRKRAAELGIKEWDRLTDGQLSDGWITGMFPNVQMGMHAEGVFIMRFVPHATDPEKFYYDNILLYRHVDVPHYDVPTWMAMPKELDLSGETRPDIESAGLPTKCPASVRCCCRTLNWCRMCSRASSRAASRARCGASRKIASAISTGKWTVTSTARSSRWPPTAGR